MQLIDGIPINDDSLAVARLNLADSIPTSNLTQILLVVDTLYFGHLWLDLAAASTSPVPFPDFYTPTERETLYINRLEIGTPNFAEWIGLAKDLLPVVQFIAVSLGLIAIPYKIIQFNRIMTKTDLEIQKLRLEIKKLQQESEKQNQFIYLPVSNNALYSLSQKAEALNGRITAESYQHKLEMEAQARDMAGLSITKYASDPSINIYP